MAAGAMLVPPRGGICGVGEPMVATLGPGGPARTARPVIPRMAAGRIHAASPSGSVTAWPRPAPQGEGRRPEIRLAAAHHARRADRGSRPGASHHANRPERESRYSRIGPSRRGLSQDAK